MGYNTASYYLSKDVIIKIEFKTNYHPSVIAPNRFLEFFIYETLKIGSFSDEVK